MSKIGPDPLTLVLDEKVEALNEDFELYEYWLLIRPCWQKILICTLGAIFMTVFLTIFAFSYWYRAQTVLRPASQEDQYQQEFMASATGMMNDLGSSVSSALGLGGNDNDAQEFMVILASYDFTINLVQKYQLQSHILPPTFLRRLQQRLGMNPYTPWKQFQKMQSLLDVNYDMTTGNLTLGFQDENREMARKILGYFVDELRDVLRKHVAFAATVAVDSLEHERSKTADALLVQQLDLLVAQQLQDKLTAEMQTDFAFTVDDPPNTPEWPHAPWIFINPLAALGLTPLFCVLWIVFYERVYKPQRALYERRLGMQSAETGTEPLSGENQPANVTVQRLRQR